MKATKTLALLSLVITAAACGSRAPAKGACIVEFDDLGNKGRACTVDTEAACKRGTLPDVHPGGMGSSKMQSFAAGKTCADEGYTTGGCSNVAIAWTFNGKCL